MPKLTRELPQFDSPLSPEALYWLGWLATDGAIVSQNGASKVTLCLSSKDADRVREFAKFTGLEEKVATKQGSDQTYVVVCSTSFARRLAELGITERKSKTLQVANELESSPEFWIGAIEGDGWVTTTTTKKPYGTYQYPVIGMCSASKLFIEQYQRFVLGLTGTVGKVTRGESTYSVSKSGDQARALYRSLKEATRFQPKLDRKWGNPLLQEQSRVERNQLACELCKAGNTLTSIAGQIGLSLTQVKEILRGVPKGEGAWQYSKRAMRT